MNSSKPVRILAIHNLVWGERVDFKSSKRWLFLKDVSIKIWVLLCLADIGFKAKVLSTDSYFFEVIIIFEVLSKVHEYGFSSGNVSKLKIIIWRVIRVYF
jgi:hypothetical protein